MKEIIVSDKLYELIKKVSESELENLLEQKINQNINLKKKKEVVIASCGDFQIYSDGASRGNPGFAGAGFVIFNKDKKLIFEGREYLGEVTNNVAEWKALILALKKASELGIKSAECFMDSKLVAEQASGNYKVKNSGLQKLFLEFHNIRQKFKKLSFKYIPREQNAIADKLANEAIDQRA